MLERYLEERNHKLFLKEDGCLLSVEYPYLLSCVSFGVSLMCSGLRFDEDQLELSKLDFSQDYLTADIKKEERLEPVLSSISESGTLRVVSRVVFGVSKEEIKQSWGETRVQQLKDVLDDITTVSEEHKQLLAQLHTLN